MSEPASKAPASSRVSAYEVGSRPQRPRASSGLYGRVIDELGQDIIDSRVASGSILLADELCLRFGVSRSVIRECLRTLGSMGLVEGRPHVGTRVLAPEHWDLLDPQVVTWRARGIHYIDQMRQLLELRLGVEQAASRLAAERLSPQAAEEIHLAALRMQTALEDDNPGDYFEADAQFHRLLLQGTDNPVIAQLAGTIAAALQVRRHDGRPGMKELSRHSVDRHLELAAALLDRDGVRAEVSAASLVHETLEEFEALERPNPNHAG
jgi:DNA-binding FadR family transcriptional regulator